METLADPAHRQTTLEPREGLFGLFGWNTVSKDAKQVRECHYTILNAFFRLSELFFIHLPPPPHTHTQVVITANEFDAIAVNQSTRMPAVALPSGISSLPPEVSWETLDNLSTRYCSCRSAPYTLA